MDPAAPSVTLCMIVRDEEELLAECLRSAAPCIDEICIVDTGSTDRTVEIALRHGARVSCFPWCDDFSAARNASLAMARGDWVLVLDADERVDDADARAKLRTFAAAHAGTPGHVTVVNRVEGDEVTVPVTRFFPRAADPNFRGRIHEQLFLGDDCPPREATGLLVRHEGYAQEVLAGRDKLARNERVLLAELREQPGDPYLLYQLGRNHQVKGDPEPALEAFTSALDGVEPSLPFLPSLLEHTGQCLLAVGRGREAYDLLRQVSGGFPDRADMVYLEALLALDCGELEAAERGFQRCLALGAEGTAASGGPLPGAATAGGAASSAAVTFGPCYHLGLLRENLGLPDEARAFYERALEYRPDHGHSRAGLQRLNR